MDGCGTSSGAAEIGAGCGAVSASYISGTVSSMADWKLLTGGGTGSRVPASEVCAVWIRQQQHQYSLTNCYGPRCACGLPERTAAGPCDEGRTVHPGGVSAECSKHGDRRWLRQQACSRSAVCYTSRLGCSWMGSQGYGQNEWQMRSAAGNPCIVLRPGHGGRCRVAGPAGLAASGAASDPESARPVPSTGRTAAVNSAHGLVEGCRRHVRRR